MVYDYIINRHGLNIRQVINLNPGKSPLYEVYTYGQSSRLTTAEFKEVVLDLVKYLMEVSADA